MFRSARIGVVQTNPLAFRGVTMSHRLLLPNKAIAFAAMLIAHHSVVCSVGRADIRPHYGDGAIVDRSEVIAIGHLKKGTVRRVPHPRGSSHEHHATLVLREILKGDLEQPDVTLLVQHGLAFAIIDQRIEIRDTSTSPLRVSPIVSDARQDGIESLDSELLSVN